MKTLYPSTTSKWVMDLINNNKTGVIHSVFNSGINIKINDNLVYLGTRSVPFGIMVVEDVDYKKMKPGEMIVFKDHSMSISGYRFDLNRVNINRFVISDKPQQRTIIEFINYCSELRLQTGFDKTIAELFQYLSTIITSDYYDLVRYCMGRGIGLTPSGDDVLVGFIYSRYAQKNMDRVLIETVSDLLKEVNTTTVSRQYIEFALSGRFSQEIIDLHNSLCENKNIDYAINKIISIGHTSGMDTLAGIYLGFLVSKEKMVNE